VTNKLANRPNGDIEVNVPYFLDWEYFIYWVFFCCRSKEFKEYDKVVTLGMSNFKLDMDLIKTIRRNRMHGFGLNFILQKSFRSNAARLAFSRPLKENYEIVTRSNHLREDPTDLN
jgi:hypothetical protein